MNPATQTTAYLSACATLLVLWVLYRLFTGTWSVGKIIEGVDGHPSTSKLQWFLWTVVVLFSYVLIYAAQAVNGNFEAITNIPDNLLIAMGISSLSMVAAKGITVSQVEKGQVVKPMADPHTTSLGSIVQSDSGTPDLSKIQVMAWTIIAIGVYIVQVVHTVNNPGVPTDGTSVTLALPDIGSSLMLLMGLGHGAYLGKKLVSAPGGINTVNASVNRVNPAGGAVAPAVPGTQGTAVGVPAAPTGNVADPTAEPKTAGTTNLSSGAEGTSGADAGTATDQGDTQTTKNDTSTT